MKYENQNKLKEAIDAIIKSENEELFLSYEKNQKYNVELHKKNKELENKIEKHKRTIDDMSYIIKKYEIITDKYFDVDHIIDWDPESWATWLADIVVYEVTKDKKYHPKYQEIKEIKESEMPF